MNRANALCVLDDRRIHRPDADREVVTCGIAGVRKKRRVLVGNLIGDRCVLGFKSSPEQFSLFYIFYVDLICVYKFLRV